jgi:hypothetical protein
MVPHEHGQLKRHPSRDDSSRGKSYKRILAAPRGPPKPSAIDPMGREPQRRVDRAARTYPHAGARPAAAHGKQGPPDYTQPTGETLNENRIHGRVATRTRATSRLLQVVAKRLTTACRRPSTASRRFLPGWADSPRGGLPADSGHPHIPNGPGRRTTPREMAEHSGGTDPGAEPSPAGPPGLIAADDRSGSRAGIAGYSARSGLVRTASGWDSGGPIGTKARTRRPDRFRSWTA